MSGIHLIALSSLIATVGLLGVIIATKRTHLIREYASTNWKMLFFSGFLGTFLSNWLFVEAIQRLLAQDASILYYLWPLFVVIFSAILSNHSISLRSAIGLLISFAGVIIVITQGNIFSLMFGDILGIIFAVGSALSYGLFLVLAKHEKIDPMVGSFFYYTVASLFSLPIAFLTVSTLDFYSINWIGILWIGLGVSTIGLVAWITALQKGDSARIANYGFLIPFISLVYIYFLTGENIHVTSIAGLCLVIGGIILQPKTN